MEPLFSFSLRKVVMSLSERIVSSIHSDIDDERAAHLNSLQALYLIAHARKFKWLLSASSWHVSCSNLLGEWGNRG
jgi:hypothetical protein